jgi:hemolysin activation/secretion protein
LATFAVFRPGLHPGETDLLVSAIEERGVDSQVHVDNYGSEFTGEYRTRLDMNWNNPFDAIDKLSVSLSKTIDPSNGTYGALNYERQAFGPNNIFGVGVSENDYSLGAALEPFGITGTTTLAQLYWRHAFHRSRLFNSYGLLQFSRKSAKLNVTEGEDRADELTVASVETGFDWASNTYRHMITSRIKYSQGFDGLLGAMEPTSDPALTDASRRGGSGIFAGGAFSKVNFNYDHWYRFMPNHTVHFSFRAQQSDDLLTSLEQMPIGGPNSVRAYATSEYLRDEAYSTSIEWLMRAPGFSQWKAFGNKRWGEILQFVLFADYATGSLNDHLASDREEVSLSGVGAGMRFQYKKFSARFEFASAVGDEPVSNERDPQYFFELNYGF